ncbi:MAG: nucleotidyltransferase family protein [Clostridia bacterium]|nr:nucleotidyltransferase family protein [Clostridia bacterium]
MKAIILAAGYATRLYPLTLNKPKALLTIGKQTILDFVVNEIKTITEIDEIFIITNDKFYQQFCEWNNSSYSDVKITVLNDNTTDDTNKLGAIGDIQFVIDKMSISDDILIMASDNIFTFKLIDFYNEFKKKHKDMILISEIENKEDLKRMANVVTDENGRVLEMVEKPPVPISDTAAYASYFYKKDTIPLLKEYLTQGNNPDAPGFFPSWLCSKKDVYAYKFQGECYDIGTPQAYKEIGELFKDKE